MSQPEATSRLSRRHFLQGIGAAGAATAAPSLPSAKKANIPWSQTALHRAAATPPTAVIALNRMGFGPRPGDIAAFNALGATAETRLSAYIDQQLNPNAIDDSELQNRLVAAGFTTLAKSLEQLWLDHVIGDTDYSYRTLPMQETERATFLRALYSRRQLMEVLANFWHDHFNVYGWDYRIAPVFVHYDRDVIRTHMLGNFRQMLEAVATSTAMLYYLDNFTNSREGPNENWARELFELHTLGAENYLGVLRQNEVPVDEEGQPVGYVDDDVYEATRCFTGWTVADRESGPGGDTGKFLYRDNWHDRFQKNVLGTYIPPDQAAMVDGRTVLDLLATHPGTAHHICGKLCRRLISDTPPESVIQSAAALFLAQKDAPNQLKQVVDHILRSDAFRTTWGEKIKRPFAAIVSGMRATNANFSFQIDDDDSDSFLWYYGHIGQPLFQWRAPNGYPDLQEDWQGTTSLLMRWRLFNRLVEYQDDSDNYRLNVLGQTPGHVRSPNELADFWINRLLGRSLEPAAHQEIVDFIAQGRNPDTDLLLDTDEAVQERLRSMVALIMMSPDFQQR